MSNEEITQIAADLISDYMANFELNEAANSDAALRAMNKFITNGLTLVVGSFDGSQFNPESGFHWCKASRTMTLNSNPINAIYQELQGDGAVLGFNTASVKEMAVGCFLFHELSHIIQGLSDFKFIETFKKTAGYNELGIIDTLADFISARAMSIAVQDKKWEASDFLKGFLFFLDLNCMICVRVFGAQKQHKMRRALSLILGAARVRQGLQNNVWKWHYSQALQVHLDLENNHLICTNLENPSMEYVIYEGKISTGLSDELRAGATFNNYEFIKQQLRGVKL